MHLAILDDYQNASQLYADWASLAGRVDVHVYHDTLLDEEQLVDRLRSCEIVCTMRERTKFSASLLSRLPKLKLITTTGMRNRAIDLQAAQANGVVVSGTQTGGNSTVEHIWALIFAVARHIPQDDASVKASDTQWQKHIPTGLAGKTLGLLGVGNLGKKVAQIAKMFDLRVIAWSPNLTPERAAEAGAEFAPSKAELFKQADLLSVHLVLAPSTTGLVSADDLALLKPSALLINTSRGPIVDEAALVSALQKKQIAGAALDVFDVEPLPLDHPLRTLNNVVMTPHTGYVSDDQYKVFWPQTVENVANFLDGKPSRVLSA